MIVWIRNIVIIFVLLSVVFVLLSTWARFRQRAKLNTEYKALDKPQESKMSKDVFIEKGMQKYNRSLKPKLIFGVFLVPLAASAILIYLAQYT